MTPGCIGSLGAGLTVALVCFLSGADDKEKAALEVGKVFGWVSPSDLTLPLWEVLVDESTSEVFPQFLGESPILGTEELLNEMREARPAAVLTFEESCEDE